jgi:predicted DNA-binding transcriptional regulator YafY
MYHPTTRVLTVLELLQAYGSMGGGELAERMEVDRRTVRRYILMLQDLGIPIETTRGPGGGYHLRPGFKLPPLMFNDDEALAIVLSLIAARRQGIPAETHTIEGALAKIERVLPTALRLRLQAVQSSVAFVPKPAVAQPPSEMVLLLSTAVQQQRRVHLRYQTRGEETERSVDPYGLVLHWNNWYMAGWCHLRQGVRVFRLDRISAALPEEATFTRPEGLDVLALILESLANAPAGWKIEVLLETTLAHAQELLPPGSVLLEERERGVIMLGYSDQLDWLARQLLTFQCPFVILQPPELREALVAVGAEAAAIAARR